MVMTCYLGMKLHRMEMLKTNGITRFIIIAGLIVASAVALYARGQAPEDAGTRCWRVGYKNTAEGVMFMQPMRYPIEIIVRDSKGREMPDARVVVQPWGEKSAINAEYDPMSRRYGVNLAHIRYVVINVEHPDYESERRIVPVNSSHQEITFILMKPGEPYTYLGQGRAPYLPRPDLIGFVSVMMRQHTTSSVHRFRTELASRMDVLPEDIEIVRIEGSAQARVWGMIRLDTMPKRHSGTSTAQRGKLLKKLRSDRFIETAGPVYSLHTDGTSLSQQTMSILANRLYVQFLPDVPVSEQETLMHAEGLKVVQTSQPPALLMVEAGSSVGDDINQIAGRLLATGKVVSAYIDIVQLLGTDY